MPEVTMENVEQVFRGVDIQEQQKAVVKLLEDRFTEMAKTIITNVPRCADRSAALRDLRVCKMTCIYAVAKGGLI